MNTPWFGYHVTLSTQDFEPLQTLTHTQAWLVQAASRTPSKEAQQYFDATTESLVEHRTVHHIDDFNQHYQQALAHAQSLGYQEQQALNEAHVFWLPSPQGYCLCGFIFQQQDQRVFVVSPVEMPFFDEALAA